jgi:hypothetical protein
MRLLAFVYEVMSLNAVNTAIPHKNQAYANHWQTVMSFDDERTWPCCLGFQASPYLVETNQHTSAKPARGTLETYPSWLWPTSLMSGLHTPSLSGSLGCLVRSKMKISPVIVLVAIRSGFCGMYLARLISPSWLMRCEI